MSKFRGDESYEDRLARKAKEKSEGKPRFGQSRTPLKRGGGQLKKTKLNPVSQKQKKRNSEYAAATKRHYDSEHNRTCAICGTGENLSIHHVEGRGQNTASEQTFITLCITGNRFSILFPQLNKTTSGCHGGVHANGEWARENGYLK